MRPNLSRTPTWLLFMPSVAVGLTIYSMEGHEPLLEPSSQLSSLDASFDASPSSASPSAQLVSTSSPSAVDGVSEIERSLVAAQPPPRRATPKNGLAKYEPARGAYLGVAIDAAASNGDPQALSASMRDWNARSGRRHALQMGFVQFPTEQGGFPTFDTDPNGWLPARAFAQAADENGATPILTLEPFQNPNQFSRGWKPGTKAYEATKTFAQGVGAWRKPVFVRWAHEMNGSWYPWAEWMDKNQNMKRDPGEDTGVTPRDYRLGYRNVASLFRKFAPNAALVWCPNSGLLGGERRDVFRPFYPGDDVVDWVALDAYERGWTAPMPGQKLWGGQFAHNLTRDMADDPKTPWNESVDFYKTFAQNKKKPMMLAETSATLSFRSDLDAVNRGLMNNEWKSRYWNANEYGWMQAVYGTSAWQKQNDRKLLHPIDKSFPRLKAVVWFQIAKNEWIPIERTRGARKSIEWFNDAYTDYRIGGGIDKSADLPFQSQEIDLYRSLTNNPYFLSRVQP
jgi:hypothetical protein